MDLGSWLPPLLGLLAAGAGGLIAWGQIQTRLDFLRRDIDHLKVLSREGLAELHARVDKRRDEVAALTTQCALSDQRDVHLDSHLKQLSEEIKALSKKFDEVVKVINGRGSS